MIHFKELDGHYDTKQSAEKLGVHVARLPQLVKEGRLPSPTKVKGSSFYPVDAVERLIEHRKQVQALIDNFQASTANESTK